MTLTERDVRILRDLDRCGALLTNTIRDEHFPGDKTGRHTRRRLGEMKNAGLIYGRLVIVGERFNQASFMSWALKKEGRKLLEVQDDPSMVS